MLQSETDSKDVIKTDWKNSCSTHYSIFYHPGSVAEQNLCQIAAWQEKCYQRLSSELGYCLPDPIRLYLCNSPEEIARITGCPPCNGMTFDYDLIYAVYNEATRCLGPHEDAHLFSYQIAIPESVFLRESFAMFFDQKYHGRSNVEITKEWFRANSSFPVSSLLDNEVFQKYPEEVVYPLAGAFAEWVIQRNGMQTYLEIFRNERLMNQYLSLPIDSIDSMFAEAMEGSVITNPKHSKE